VFKDQIDSLNKKDLKAYLNDLHPHDLAEDFFELSDSQKERIYQVIDDQKLSEMVAYLDVEDAAEMLAEFDLKKQKVLVEMMEPDDAADIILEMEDDEQEELLATLDQFSDVMQLINYDEDETGSAMTNAILTIMPDMDVKVATKKVIKEAPDVESVQTIFVVDENNHYLGVVKLKDLLKTKTPCEVSTLILDYPTVKDKDLITQSVQAIRNYAIYEIPVIDDENKLLGMLTLDDALDIYQDEAQEDYEKLAGLPETLDLPSFKTALHRLPWLVTLLIMFIPLMLVTSFFEETLAYVAILIFFQPLILDMAGNVATQTLAVTLKTLATDEKNLVGSSIKEIITGIINGLVIGVIAFIMTYIFAEFNTGLQISSITLAFVVGLSLWLTVFLAPISAIIIPVTLKFLKADPAAASGPFITTFIDVAALFIYFGLATMMLLGGV